MDPRPAWIIPLKEIKLSDLSRVGGKAANLARLYGKGYRVPDGFCLTVAAYDYFLEVNQLESVIRTEISRKPFKEMRWEELWDCTLRIRNAFLAAEFPDELRRVVVLARKDLRIGYPVAVRSTGSHEDKAGSSFAGLHESFINVRGEAALLQSIRLVWASLWSDSAMLYKKELKLEPNTSKMAVLVQAMVRSRVSGVAFGKDPRALRANCEVVESVPGLCATLVSGETDPDRWFLDHRDGKILSWTPGQRKGGGSRKPLLKPKDLGLLHRSLRSLARDFGWEPDVEWTGQSEGFTILQARPVTAPLVSSAHDKRPWYLSLKPPPEKLFKLAKHVSEKLIPELMREGERMAAADIETLSPVALGRELRQRYKILKYWRGIYENYFIPFAHGVRYFGIQYNDLMHPEDPFEFVKLLQGEGLITIARNRAMKKMAQLLDRSKGLKAALKKLLKQKGSSPSLQMKTLRVALLRKRNGTIFLKRFHDFIQEYGDVSYANKRLTEEPAWVLSHLVQSRSNPKPAHPSGREPIVPVAGLLERKFLRKAGSQRKKSREILRIARLSWKLRDDDNILLARVESQFLRALSTITALLKHQGRLKGREPEEEDLGKIHKLLKSGKSIKLKLVEKPKTEKQCVLPRGEMARQMTGNAASPGLASGLACCVLNVEDFKKFRKGNVLVCDAIQPQLTHLVPLASAVIERRGGMLIHGAIIARELGIPCVNGITGLMTYVRDGMPLTVDGHLGIVSVGEPEFNLETHKKNKK
jgi:phosphohistidine swiveling domain-containing protein